MDNHRTKTMTTEEEYRELVEQESFPEDWSELHKAMYLAVDYAYKFKQLEIKSGGLQQTSTHATRANR